MSNFVMTMLYVALATSFMFYVSLASDPTPLQDFCVGIDDANSAVVINGKLCKNPKDVTINDFLHKGFNIRADTNNTEGANATLVDITRFPGINTQGVSLARVDFGPFGLNTPHWHPRGSEIFAVLEGSLYAGFVTTDYKLYDTILNDGDMIIFPQGLVHFQMNIKNTDALAIASFGSQNPGRVDASKGVFGTNPQIKDYVLTKAYKVDRKVVEQLRDQFWMKTWQLTPRN